MRAAGIPLEPPRFAALHSVFYSAVAAEPLTQPSWVAQSPSALALFDWAPGQLDQTALAQLSGNTQTAESPGWATVYAGHQFGVFVPQLGDGRALLIGEAVDVQGGRWEVQLKGSGRTPYSRFADGRAVLRSSIREYLASEAMAALGIPTTRALCLTASDDLVQRETMETAAIVTRLAPSFIRFGHFEYFASRHAFAALAPLANLAIEQGFPDLVELPAPERYERWLTAVIQRSAALVAAWQAVGFCHGVLNTDNMSALGLTLDYGPYGFMEAFDPGFICNHSDESGRYAYREQPGVVYWNCSRMVQATLPLLSSNADEALEIGQSLLATFPDQFSAAWLVRLRAKFGFVDARERDETLMEDFLSVLAEQGGDFTRSFRALSQLGFPQGDLALRQELGSTEALDAWLRAYRARMAAETDSAERRRARMDAVNPCYVLRNWLAQRAIERAQHKDFSEIEKLSQLLSQPFTEQAGFAEYTQSAPEWARSLEVSCSS